MALAKKGNARRGRAFLIILLGIGAFIGIPAIYNAFDETPATTTTAVPATANRAAAPVVDLAASKADYLKKVSTLSSVMRDMKVEATGDSTDAMMLVVDIFNAGARLVRDGSSMPLDKEEVAKVQQLAEALVQRQRQAFPIMRRKFGPISAELLWEGDIVATTTGARFTTATFVGGRFAAHKNIATVHCGTAVRASELAT
jgi:hypothetical protein